MIEIKEADNPEISEGQNRELPSLHEERHSLPEVNIDEMRRTLAPSMRQQYHDGKKPEIPSEKELENSTDARNLESERKEQRQDPEILETQRLIFERLKELRQLGHELKVSPGYCTPYGSGKNDKGVIQAQINSSLSGKLGNDIHFIHSFDPLEEIRYNYPMAFELSRDLSDAELIQVFPFSVRISNPEKTETDSGNTRERFDVKLIDWLNTKEPAQRIGSINVTADNVTADNKTLSDQVATITNKIEKIIKERFSSEGIAKLNERLDQITQPAEGSEQPRPTIQALRAETNPGQREKLKALMQKLKTGIELEFIPHGKEVDSYLTFGGYFPKKPSLIIDESFIARLGDNPIEFNGEITAISASKEMNSFSEPSGPQIVMRDESGVTTVSFEGYGRGSIKTLCYHPRTRCGKPGVINPPSEPLSVDLSYLFGKKKGSVTLGDLIRIKPLPSIGTIGDTVVYTNMDFKEAQRLIEPHAVAIKAGMDRAKELFGFNPVGRIAVQEAKRSNATASIRNGHTITFRDEILKDASKMGFSLQPVSFHEAMHILDFDFNISKGKIIQQTVEKVNTSLISNLSESVFTQNEWCGGHASDNTIELTASILNVSLNLSREKWESYVDFLSSPNKSDYARLLKAYKQRFEQLSGEGKIDPQAPVFRVLESRIEFLKRQTGHPELRL